MAKTKFSINRETLIEEQDNGYILTRVPNSNMEYYWLLNEKDIVSSDEMTLVVECDPEQDIAVLPRVYSGDESRRPTLQEAIREIQEPTSSIFVKSEELYHEYYFYDKNLDPEQRAEQQRIRDQKRQEALARSDASKNMRQQVKQQTVRNNSKSQTTNSIHQDVQDTSQIQQTQTPAQRMAQKRAQIPHYTKQQFKEILKCHRQKLDASMISNIDLSHQQMKELRLAMKVGLDVSKYNSPFISAKHMKEIRLGAKRGVRFDMDKLDHSLYNAEQMHELRLGFEKKLDVKKYLNPAYEAAQMKELRLAMQAGLDTRKLEDIHLSVDQMHAIRHQMVLSDIGDVLKRFFEKIRDWISEKIQVGMEHINANLQNRDPMNLDELKEANMKDAIAEIKYTLVQSELLPERAYEDVVIDDKIRNHIEELMSYMESPEPDVEKAIEVAAEDICQAVGAEISVPREEKVVSINQANNHHEHVSSVTAEQERAISEAIDQQLQQAYEMDQEIVIEEEAWEMMQ